MSRPGSLLRDPVWVFGFLAGLLWGLSIGFLVANWLL